MQLTDRDFERLKNFMYDNYGINLEKKRTLIETRLLMMVKRSGFSDYSSYIDSLMLDKTGEQVSLLVEKLTTNYTYFMREEKHFEFLKEHILVPYSKKSSLNKLRIWSAASSTGEEAYCIAMLAASILGMSVNQRVEIKASDISEKVLKQAKNGIYSDDKIDKLPPSWVHNYFKKINEKDYEVIPSIKQLVEFKYFNLNNTIGWERSKYDIIFCRNVMIYFDNVTNQNLVNRLYNSLKPGGYLIIGMSESLSSLKTELKRIKPSVYKK